MCSLCDCEICSCCMWMCIFHSPLCEQPTAGWDLGSFQFGAVMDSAAMNTLDVSLCEHGGSFLWIYIFRQGISDEGIWHYEIFANLHSHQQFRRF